MTLNYFHKLVQKQRKQGQAYINELHIGDGLYSGTENIIQGFKKHFETLATPSENTNFNQKYHDMNIYEVSVISDLVRSQKIPAVTSDELSKTINSINKGKAADMYKIHINVVSRRMRHP